MNVPNTVTIFQATTASTLNIGAELWRSTNIIGTTVLVRDIYEGPTGSFPNFLTYLPSRNIALFAATNAAAGRELWRTDGTFNGTVMVSDIRNGSFGSSPTGLTLYNNEIYFSADTADLGSELYASDGITTRLYVAGIVVK